MKSKFPLFVVVAAWGLLTLPNFASAQGTAFTYQGRLNNSNSPANGSYDIKFSLFNGAASGTQVGSTVTDPAVGVTNGLFVAQLDFGAPPFNGQSLWLQIAVSPAGSNTFTNLSPRQALSAAPYAVQSLNASTAGTVTGTVALAQLPAAVLTNGANGVNVIGTFSGNGAGLTNLVASQLIGTLTNQLNTSGTVTAIHFSGDGSGLTGVAKLTGGNTLTGTQTVSNRALAVASGSSVDTSLFLQLYNGFTDGNFSSADIVGISFGQNSTRQAIVGGTYGNDFLDFYTGGLLTTPKMRIDYSGNVGIGTATPANKLDVQGSADFSGSVGIGTVNTPNGSLEIDSGNGFVPGYNPIGYLIPTGAGSSETSPVGNISMWASGGVFSLTFVAFSDERIKNIIHQSEGAADLRTLLGIKITDYTYKDTIAKGNRPQKKVIAQQVEQVYPQAVTKGIGEVPDIYKQAAIKDGWIQLDTDLKTGERVKLIGTKGKGTYPVLEVKEGAFRTDFKPGEDKVFVYGREVIDFRSVDYEAIAMLNVSATQELARRVEAEASEVAALKQELAEMKKQMAQLARNNRSVRQAVLTTNDDE